MRREMHPQSAERTAGSAAAGPRPRPAHAAPCRPDSAVKRVAQRRASGRSAAQRGLHGLSQGCAWLARQSVWTAGACVACAATSARQRFRVRSFSVCRIGRAQPLGWRRASRSAARWRLQRRSPQAVACEDDSAARCRPLRRCCPHQPGVPGSRAACRRLPPATGRRCTSAGRGKRACWTCLCLPYAARWPRRAPTTRPRCSG
jgi:hypothetical protein